MRQLFSLLMILGLATFVTRAAAQTTFTAELDGRQTVPPASTLASGTCIGTLNADETEFTFSCTHNANNATDGHIHEGAVGISGGVVFEFAEDECCPASSTWMLSAEDAAALKAGNLYVNIHSEIFAVEEIRGQLLADTGGPADDPGEDTTFRGVCGSFGGLGMMMLVAGLTVMRLRRSRG